MRILYLCHRIPYPPNKGEKIRAFNQLKAISASHIVDLFTLADDFEELGHRATLEKYCASVTIARIVPRLAKIRAVGSLLTSSPLTIPYFFSRKLQRRVREALRARTYDRIFVYCSAMAQYVDVPEAQGIPVVVDLVDVDSDKWRQYSGRTSFPYSWIYRREARLLSSYEKSICNRAAAVAVTTAREARLVAEMCAAARVEVIPNGVDQEYFKPDQVTTLPLAPTICFTGDMSYYPNQDAVIFFTYKVLPLIRRAIPNVRFLIVGRQPSAKVKQLAQIQGVQVTGFVPDVRPYLAYSQVSVAPFRIAAGIQNKVLEAMSCGLPVVATSRIRHSLSESVAGVVEFGDGPDELASKTSALFLDAERRHRVGLEGRRRVGLDYDWGASLKRLVALLEDSNSPRVAGAKKRRPVPLHPVPND